MKNDMTDNHGYETPKKGATEWHESLNRNFKYIDRDVEIRDINAAKTDYRPKSGAKFLATDTEDVYVGDGSQWLRLATSGENPSFDTVSAKTIVDRNSGNGYSVDQLAGGGGGSINQHTDAIILSEGSNSTAYRADGTKITENTDDGAVIQAAIDDVGTGSRVTIGPGDFKLTGTIKLPNQFCLKGAGMYGGTRLFITDDTFGKRIQGGGGGASRPRRIIVEDIHFDAQNNDRTILKFGVVGGPQFVFVRRCRVTNSGAKGGMHIRPDTDNSAHDFGFIDCVAERCGGVSLDMGATAGEPHPKYGRAVNNRIYNPVHERSFTHGISVEGIDNCVVANNIVHQDPTNIQTTLAYNINKVKNATVVGNVARNVQNGINCSNGVTRNVVIANNTVQNWKKQAIEIQTGNVNTVEDVLVQGNTLVNGAQQAIQVNNDAHANIMNNHIRDCPKNGNSGKPSIQIYQAKYPCHIIENHIVNTNGEAAMGGNDPTNNSHKQVVAFNTGRSTAKTWQPGQKDRLVIGNSIDSGHFASSKATMIANDYDREYSPDKGVKIANSVGTFPSTNTGESTSTFIHHDPNSNHITEDSGSVTQSGDGTTAVFTISHGLSAPPAAQNVWPKSADAAGDFYISNVDGSNIEMTYTSAPASGTDNLTWGFSARVWS